MGGERFVFKKEVEVAQAESMMLTDEVWEELDGEVREEASGSPLKSFIWIEVASSSLHCVAAHESASEPPLRTEHAKIERVEFA